MFNFEKEWALMEQHQRHQIRQAWSVRLAEEAACDRVPWGTRVELWVSKLLTGTGLRLKAHCRKRAEKAHHYIADPQDKVYT
jgi:hypothetical protein